MKDEMRIWALLDIVYKSVGLPKLKAIHDWAEAELVGIAKDIDSVPENWEPAPTASQLSPAVSGTPEESLPRLGGIEGES